MGKSLAEYAAENPRELTELEREELERATTEHKAAVAVQEKAEELKRSILLQIERGEAPQTILYTAVKCIALLSHDPEFAEAGASELDTIYADLAQQSLLVDNAAIEAQRLKARQAEYNAKLAKMILKQMRSNHAIHDELKSLLYSIDGEKYVLET